MEYLTSVQIQMYHFAEPSAQLQPEVNSLASHTKIAKATKAVDAFEETQVVKQLFSQIVIHPSLVVELNQFYQPYEPQYQDCIREGLKGSSQ